MNTPQPFFLGVASAVTAFTAVQLPQDSTTAAGEPLAPAAASAPLEAVAQDSAPIRPFLDPVEPVDPLRPAADLESEFRGRLADRNLDARERAFDEVALWAARDGEARRALEAIADDAADVDLAFTARLALREADRAGARRSSPFRRPFGGRSPFGGRAAPLPDWPSLGTPLDERLESLFGGDPFSSFSLGGTPLRTLDDMREEMDRLMDELRGGTVQAPRGARSMSSSVSVQTTPDGVRVELTEDDGSGPVQKTFEADSLDVLLEAHPELRGKIGR